MSSKKDKEKGATFARDNDLIEEHLKAAFKAATDANNTLREEVALVRKQIADETARATTADYDIRKQQEEQRDLMKQMSHNKDSQIKDVYEAYERLRDEREAAKLLKANQTAEIKQARDALDSWRKGWEEEKGLEEGRIVRLDDEIRQQEDRWSQLNKKGGNNSGKDLESKMKGDPKLRESPKLRDSPSGKELKGHDKDKEP